MSEKTNTMIAEALGVPNTVSGLNFTSSATSGYLDPGAMYRFVATEDCYVHFMASGVHDADSDDMLLISSIPEVFCTTNDKPQISVVRKDTDGTLNIVKLLTRRV